MAVSTISLSGRNDLLKLCDSFGDTKILVIGDVMLDRFVYGSVNRISPESPVPILSTSREDVMLGGAGNAYANLTGLGVQAQLFSVIGDDEEGQNFQNLLSAQNQKIDGLVKDPSRPTTVKTRYLAGHQQMMRADFEKTGAISSDIQTQLFAQIDAAMDGADVVVLSDYGKGVLQPALIEKIIKAARAKDIPVVIDPKGRDFSIYKGASYITPNRKELSEASNGAAVKADDEITNAAQDIIKTCGIGGVLATRSEDGMSIIQKGSDPYHVRPAQSIEVYDVSGAGDTVIATFAAALAVKASPYQAANLANLAGSIAVAKVGTSPIRLHELQAALSGDHAQNRASDLATAVEQVKRWRARGLKVGFTNGCFDILHAGHVTYLSEAKAKCDRLVVGLNSDSSVKILKGDDRPVHDEEARGVVLSALASVDLVVFFGAEKPGDDNTACAVIEALQPDLYFKGGDYTVDQIPEAPSVQAYGGKVEVLSEVAGYSTTNAIKKIRN